MKLKSLLLILSLIFSTSLFAAHHENSNNNVKLIETKTTAGSFYSSKQTLAEAFPFSDAVQTAGNFVFLSGLVGSGMDGALVEGGLVPETHAIFRQMQSHLDQFDLGFKDVVKCLVMIDEIDEWGEFNKVYTSYFKPPYPARSALGADGLALGAAVELECTAIKR